MIQRWISRAALALALFVVLATPGYTQPSWASLGPTLKSTVSNLELSQHWVRDGVMIAGGYPAGTTRTRDHGETWQRVTTPKELGDSATMMSVFDGPSGRITFSGIFVPGRGTSAAWTLTLFRSVDDGESWANVLKLGAATSPVILPSPTFEQDGTLFLNGGTYLGRSTDAGTTWENIGKVWASGISGQWDALSPVAFSPTFATDHTMVLNLQRNGSNLDKLSPDAMRGLLISTDAGTSWQPLGAPAYEGEAYPRVDVLQLSPSFAEDRTMFAIATETSPKPPGSSDTTRLFRSTDRGQTWGAVTGPLGSLGRFALSPSFAQDRTVLLYTAVGPDAAVDEGRCLIDRSMDAGDSWSGPSVVVRLPVSRVFGVASVKYETCSPFAVAQGPDGIVAMIGQNFSYDLGQSWQTIAPPEGVTFEKVEFSPGFAQDGTILFLAKDQGIWAYGSQAKTAAGAIVCDIPPSEEITRLMENPSALWGALGCPTEAAAPARFTLGSASQGAEDIWPSTTYGVRRTPAQSGPSSTPGVDDFWASNQVTSDLKLPEPPKAVVDGFIQRFEGGSAWGLIEKDGKVTRVLLLEGEQKGHYQILYSR